MSTAHDLITRIATDADFREGLEKLPANDRAGYLESNGFSGITKDQVLQAIEPAISKLSPADLAAGNPAMASSTTTATTVTTVTASASAAVAAA